MSNDRNFSLEGLSHFLMAIGVFIVVLMVFAFMAQSIIEPIFGISLAEIQKVGIENITVNQGLAIKFAQFFTPFGILVSSLIFCTILKTKFTSFVGIQNRITMPLLGLSVLLLIAIMPLIAGLLELNSKVSFPADLSEIFREAEDMNNNLYALMLKHNSGIHLVVNFFLMALLPAISEEVFFRGVLMRVSAKMTGNIWSGIAISSFIFALIHLQPYKFLAMFFIAFMFGYLYYRTGSLWIPIVLHTINNSMAIIGSRLENSGLDAGILAEDATLGWPWIVGGLVATFLLIWVIQKNTDDLDFSYE
ncbi:MAG: CPBP family intramembrane metalloprotease [Flavobacteriales bacterium]|nr:CPBP family intramembrane metalloprotease [Flavobacteriales bacterium]